MKYKLAAHAGDIWELVDRSFSKENIALEGDCIKVWHNGDILLIDPEARTVETDFITASALGGSQARARFVQWQMKGYIREVEE